MFSTIYILLFYHLLPSLNSYTDANIPTLNVQPSIFILLFAEGYHLDFFKPHMKKDSI